jgi:hypothetical protein
MRLFATIVSTVVLILMPVASAGADPDTGRIRVLDCGPGGQLTVVLSPNAFSTSVPAFHDVSSNAVLTPLNVRVNGQFVLAVRRGHRGAHRPLNPPAASGYSPSCASEAGLVTATENLEGCSRTSGLSMLEIRSISLIHWSGLSTAATCRAASELAP